MTFASIALWCCACVPEVTRKGSGGDNVPLYHFPLGGVIMQGLERQSAEAGNHGCPGVACMAAFGTQCVLWEAGTTSVW